MMKFFAWASFIVALFAGAGLAVAEPVLVQIVVVLGLLAALVYDIAKDKVPNRDAVVVAITLPSLLVGMNGGIAATVSGWSTALWSQFEAPAAKAVGTSTMLVVAVAAVAVSLVLARAIPGGSSMPGMRR